jgi:cytochrome c biogenesis protein CcmG, thiol:disulfide interchange protein DsbE
LPSTPSSASPEPGRRSRVGVGTLILVGLLVLAAVAVFAAVRADTSGSDASSPTPRVSTAGIAPAGSPAPDFDLPKLRGPGRVRLADLAGKPVIVNFWASYCIPCRKEFPTFRKVEAKYRAQGLEIVGITFKDLAGDARRFANQQDATWTLALGGDGDPTGRAYGVRSPPQTFFIDRAGKIVSRFYGAPSNDRFDAEVRKIIDS